MKFHLCNQIATLLGKEKERRILRMYRFFFLKREQLLAKLKVRYIKEILEEIEMKKNKEKNNFFSSLIYTRLQFYKF